MNRRTVIGFRLIFFLAAVIISSRIYIGYRHDVAAYNNRISELSQKIEEQNELGQELDNGQDVYSSQESVEKIARDTLGLVKSDEKFFKNYNGNQ